MFAIGFFVFAGYSFGREAGYEDGRRAEEIDAPSEPSPVQGVVLILLGAIALGGASMLNAGGGAVRIPTPAALDDLAGRAESVALQRAEEAAQESRKEPAEPTV
jgi:hypothetical protein